MQPYCNKGPFRPLVFLKFKSHYKELVWSTGWTPVATIRGAGEQTAMYYIEVDHLNAPTHIRNEANQIVWSWNNREAFGYIAPNEDVDGNGTYFEFNLRFPGQWFDKETALFHNGFRDYNPSTGRYMQSDPLGLEAGFNTYAYVGNNPYRAVDPYGLMLEMLYYNYVTMVMPIKHECSGREYLCTVGQNCNVQAAQQSLRNNAYPGQKRDEPLTNLFGRRNVIFPQFLDNPLTRGFAGQPISTGAQGTCTIVNQTQPGHIFHNGSVTRSIVKENNNLYVETYGKGVNSGFYSWALNMFLWEPSFKQSNQNIRKDARGEK